MPPPGRGLSTKEIVIGLLLATGQASAAQQHRHYPPSNSPSHLQQNDDRADSAAAAVDPPDAQWRAPVASPPLQHHDLAGQRGHRDTNANVINNEGHQNNNNHHINTNKKEKAQWTTRVNERALVTVTPAEPDSVVRAPPAQWSASNNDGLSSRHLPARSLQDWTVEEKFLLLATVDGKLHARDRRTGAQRWTVQNDHDMVEIIHHPHNKTLNPDGTEQETPMFLVEPTQDGNVLLLTSDGTLTRLESVAGPITVKTLAEMSPYAAEDSNVVYTADKKNRLITINAQNGAVVKTFTSTGSIPGEDSSCRRVDPLGGLSDENELETIGFITLGQTEYTIGIQNLETGEPIATIKFFEWTTNNRDQDLRASYSSTLDKKNLYSTWDGQFYSVRDGFDRQRTEFRGKLDAPIARVYDIIRPISDRSGSADLVVLQQPLGRIQPGTAGPDAVYLNRTEKGNWYALSERHYPTVTDRARPVTHLDHVRFANMDIAGVYNSPSKMLGPFVIDGNVPYTIDAPPAGGEDRIEWVDRPALPPAKAQSGYLSLSSLVLTVVTLLCLAAGPYAAKNSDTLRKMWSQHHVVGPSLPPAESLQVGVDTSLQSLTQPRPSTPTFIREDEPAEEMVFPHDSPQAGNATSKVRFAEVENHDEAEDESPEGEDEDQAPKKKKATRGRRGGRKQKEKEAAKAEARAKKSDKKASGVQIISVAASESQEAVAGPIQINSLTIYTDKELGKGSGGTIVFEGMFESRQVAVKRMLTQFNTLASKEINVLQQSDDHDNVVRYFCQQKDEHFLYIAVELCQASLGEIWEAERAKTEERRAKLASLKLAIQKDTTRALKQLAQGLKHLHDLRILHRDIKPQNILVAYPRKSQPADTIRLVFSDFGLGRTLPEGASTINEPTVVGTTGWKAPEMIQTPREMESNHSRGDSNNGSDECDVPTVGGGGIKRAADIFSLGCVFFWVLTDTDHPFSDEDGWHGLREVNIKKNKRNMKPLERWSDAYEPMQLISSMVEHEPAKRPTAKEVLHHPFFWEPEERLNFLCDCSDYFEREDRGHWQDNYAGDSHSLKVLQSRRSEIMGPRADFLAVLDHDFVVNLGKQRKYSGDRVLDLVRAIRNKKNHFEDMEPHVKAMVGPLPVGYVTYWTTKFPRLLMTCWEIIRELGLEHTDRFKRYYPPSSK